MKKAISNLVLASIAATMLLPASVEAQFGQRIQERQTAELGQSVLTEQGSAAVGYVPMWQYEASSVPVRSQATESKPVNQFGYVQRATNVYSSPRGRALTIPSNSYRSNSVIPLRSAQPVVNSYQTIPKQRREPLTNVYRPPASWSGGNSTATYSTKPVPGPIPSQIIVAGAKDASELNNSASPKGTKLRYPASANREFVFQLDGTTYKINPGESVNLSADREYKLRFSGGTGLGDRIATLKPYESYAFDLRGDEGWVLVPEVPTSSGGGQ